MAIGSLPGVLAPFLTAWILSLSLSHHDLFRYSSYTVLPPETSMAPYAHRVLCKPHGLASKPLQDITLSPEIHFGYPTIG